MPNWDRALWAAAQQIVQNLQPLTPAEPALSLDSLQELLRLRQQWDYADERGWHVAAARVRTRLRSRASGLLRDLQSLTAETGIRPTEMIAGAGDVYRDLVALRTEFCTVEVDVPAQTVSATTERIVLEDVDLGPFQLVWNWSQAGEDDALRVHALDAQPAGGREDITHPHVRDDTLCTGQAQVPLQQALASGRLFDAFLIVRQVLRTYNSGSAYVCLEDWFAATCSACGASVTNEDITSCESCYTELCDGCRETCQSCGDAYCHSCNVICPECEERVCVACRPLVDGQRIALCPSCHEKETDDEDQDAPDNDEVPCALSSAAVHANGVGEAAVSAGCGAD